MKLSCEKVREITLMYADCIQEIPDEKAREAYLSHIESCDECRAMRNEILNDIDALHSFCDEVPMKDGVTLCDSVMQKLRAGERKSRRGYKFRYVGTAVAAVIVAVMFLGSNNPLFRNIFSGNSNISDSISSEKRSENQSAKSLSDGKLSAYDYASEDTGDSDVTVPEENHENESITNGSAKIQNKSMGIASISGDIAGESTDMARSDAPDNSAKYMTRGDVKDIKDFPQEEKAGKFALTTPPANENDEFASYLSSQNIRMSLCVVHPEGYHTIPLEYAGKIGYEAFKTWVEGITDEEVEYTPEYFKNHFADSFN